jgi:hypothetical protein
MGEILPAAGWQRDELAAFHSITSSAMAMSAGGMRAAAVGEAANYWLPGFKHCCDPEPMDRRLY